ncbi:MAG: hypothetical protein JWL63_1193 [Rhodocyclales bacterium]|nr:hypothetical protein [Rhodocyclales bacterium]
MRPALSRFAVHMPRLALLAGAMLPALLLLPTSVAAASTSRAKQHPKPAHSRSLPHSVKHVAPPRAAMPPTRFQPAVVSYTGLSSLPRHARGVIPVVSSPISAADNAEARCSAAAPPDSVVPGKVTPCLGLFRPVEAPSPITFRFDIALKSIGAPKDIFVGRCPSGIYNTACNNFISESQVEQERLADTLGGQRRYPVATLGVALSF